MTWPRQPQSPVETLSTKMAQPADQMSYVSFRAICRVPFNFFEKRFARVAGIFMLSCHVATLHWMDSCLQVAAVLGRLTCPWCRAITHPTHVVSRETHSWFSVLFSSPHWLRMAASRPSSLAGTYTKRALGTLDAIWEKGARNAEQNSQVHKYRQTNGISGSSLGAPGMVSSSWTCDSWRPDEATTYQRVRDEQHICGRAVLPMDFRCLMWLVQSRSWTNNQRILRGRSHHGLGP